MGAAALAQAGALGRTMVVVPHPDDETIGCGGLLALLATAGNPVSVVLISDGTASHPHSAAYPGPRLKALRMREMIEALATLGLHHPDVLALGMKDGAVPASAREPCFESCVEHLARTTFEFQPETVLLPWRHDDHPDHRASHAIAWAACNRAAPQSRRLEYAVWMPAHQPLDGRPQADVWRIDIDSVVERKGKALEAHRSQRGQVIHDDPAGFVLPPCLVSRCTSLLTETYFDTTEWSTP